MASPFWIGLLALLAACSDPVVAGDAGALDAGTDGSAEAGTDAGVDATVEGACEVDEAVRSGACVSCGVGATNEAGDDPRGDDTYCDDSCSVALGVDCAAYLVATLKATNAGENDTFGLALALDGDTLAVGAPGEASAAQGVDADSADDSASEAGAVYVFERSGSVWVQTAYIKASNAAGGSDLGGDRFGASLALEGDTLVVGAPDESAARGDDPGDDSAPSAGAAYVFTRDAGVWAQTAYLKASNADVADNFGSAVVVAGDLIAVGAPGEQSSATGIGGDPEDNSAPWAGAVYVFARSGSAWAQEAYLKAFNTSVRVASFGAALALEGETLVVGADGGGEAVHVFSRGDDGWAQTGYLRPAGSDLELAGDSFGLSVAISGDLIVVGAREEDSAATGVDGDSADDSAEDAGAAYVFERVAGAWTQVAYLKASNAAAGDRFGVSVAVEGALAVVGATHEDSGADGVDWGQSDDSADNAGAAYVFRRGDDGWAQIAYLKAPESGVRDAFGAALALDGELLLVGAPGESSASVVDPRDDSLPYSGAVYVRRVAP